MRWNLGLITVQAGLVVWAHAVGVSWLSLGLLLAGLALAAGAAFAYLFRVHLPRAHRRYERQLRIAFAEHALRVHAGAVDDQTGPASAALPADARFASDRGAA